MFVWAIILWFAMYQHAKRIQQSIAYSSEHEDEGKNDKEKSCLSTSDVVKPFFPFLETSVTPWHVLEQRYYALNKENLEEELNSLKKASVDILLLESRVRRIAAALEVEKDQRRALEDRLYAKVSTTETESTAVPPVVGEII